MGHYKFDCTRGISESGDKQNVSEPVWLSDGERINKGSALILYCL